jgi:hypothetical protein
MFVKAKIFSNYQIASSVKRLYHVDKQTCGVLEKYLTVDTGQHLASASESRIAAKYL